MRCRGFSTIPGVLIPPSWNMGTSLSCGRERVGEAEGENVAREGEEGRVG